MIMRQFNPAKHKVHQTLKFWHEPAFDSLNPGNMVILNLNKDIIFILTQLRCHDKGEKANVQPIL